MIGTITEGIGMNRPKLFLKRLLIPVTILLVPHSRTKPVSIRLPVLAIASSVCLFLLGASVVVTMSIRAVEHQRMKERLTYLSSQFLAMKDTMLSLKQSEENFRKLFGVKSKTAVLESTDPADTGSLDMEMLREEIEASMRSVAEIRAYVAEQKDIYLSTRPVWKGRCPFAPRRKRGFQRPTASTPRSAPGASPCRGIRYPPGPPTRGRRPSTSRRTAS